MDIIFLQNFEGIAPWLSRLQCCWWEDSLLLPILVDYFFPFSSLINFSDRLLCGPMFTQWTGLSIGELLHCCHGNFLESSPQWPLHLHFLQYLFLELSSAWFLEQPSNIFFLPFISYFLSLGLFVLFSRWFPQVYLLAACGGEESEDLVAFKTDSANSQAPGGIQLSLLA